MKFIKYTKCIILSLALAGFPLAAAPTDKDNVNCTLSATVLRGAWEKEGGGIEILFQDDQIILRKAGALSVATILRREPCKLLVLYQGLQSSWKITSDQGAVTLQADEPLRLRPLSVIPPELNLNTSVLPPPKPIPGDEVKAIEKELVARRDKDQAAVTDLALKAKRPEIMMENLQYLRDVTSKVGWIDIPRFGKAAAVAAILIAKHGSDLLLMKAALPIVERDVKENGGSGEMFSVLYDELQITLGHRQRYGTQFMPDAKGKPFVLPLEDPARVDLYRKEIGILSFKDYLKLVSDNMGGKSIRVAGSDE